MVSGRKMPTEPTSRVNASTSPSATADFPVWPSGRRRNTPRHARASSTTALTRLTLSGRPRHEQRHDLVTMTSARALVPVRARNPQLSWGSGRCTSADPGPGGLASTGPGAGSRPSGRPSRLSLNRLVAVKVDQRTLESDTEQRRFLREAGAAGRMSGHPGIVTVHDAGILTDDRPYLVMALCEGRLADQVGQGRAAAEPGGGPRGRRTHRGRLGRTHARACCTGT